MLKVQDLIAKVANRHLDGLSFKVEPGEVLAILGSSDSGKHELGQVLAGIHKTLSGEISINRYHLNTGSDKARIQLGYLPNPAPIEEFLTGYELLDLIGSIYHLAPNTRKERIQFLIDLLEIGPSVYSILETASPDVCQKVALASSVIHSPKLVILDEPTQMLDFNGPRLVGDIVKNMTNSSSSVVLITDNLELAQDLADNFLVLANGQKLIEGTMAQLLNQTHPHLRSLRGVMEKIDY
ncbi:MAG: ABC transporter ATP-binding protein [Candidatus Berkelbacteria bacterium]|nr:ABC transporter ATP-binding protein [Candidatus Berkelbacteria bacterium]MCR4307545.1 ABC transporter ATP-binding protein [Candidatus Berkelbacteria bacterium]